MPAMFGGTPIGAMQYGGTPIAEAMIDGVVVWRSIIRVTPEPPVFHEGEPWVTLPTVEGVTYSVTGTPGYGRAVSITATAQPGYELAGQTEWENEWDPLIYSESRNVRSGYSGEDYWVSRGTHTVTANVNNAEIQLTINWRQSGSGRRQRIQVNEQTIVEDSADSAISTSIVTYNLSEGDRIAFAVTGGGSTNERRVEGGSWSVYGEVG